MSKMLFIEVIGILLINCVVILVAQHHEDCTFPIPSILWSSPVPSSNEDGLFQSLEGKCVGGNSALLTTGLSLTYNIKTTGSNMEESLWVEYNSSAPRSKYCSLSNITKVNYTFIQPEHGGGDCHCFTIVFDSSCTRDNCTNFLEKTKCHLVGSKRRIVRIIWNRASGFRFGSRDKTIKEIPFSFNCSNHLRLLISFRLYTPLYSRSCDGIDEYIEGLEFAIQTSSEENWIPLQYIFSNGTFPPSSDIRGYAGFLEQKIHNNENSVYNMEVCGLKATDTIRLRWLQSASIFARRWRFTEMWALDDIKIFLISDNDTCYNLLDDSFNNLNRSNLLWNSNNVRNGEISCVPDACNYKSNGLIFGTIERSAIPTKNFISTRSVITNSISISSVTQQEHNILNPTYCWDTLAVGEGADHIETGECSSYSSTTATSRDISEDTQPTTYTLTLSDSTAYSDITLTTSVNSLVSSTKNLNKLDKVIQAEEENILRIIQKDSQLKKIMDYSKSIPIQSLKQLESSSFSTIPSNVATYLLSHVVSAIIESSEKIMSTTGTRHAHNLTKIVINVAESILEVQHMGQISDTSVIIGTTLLQLLDAIATLHIRPAAHLSDHFAIVVMQVQTDLNSHGIFTSMNTSTLAWPGPHSAITIPVEQLKDFASNDYVSFISTVFKNATSFFPHVIGNDTHFELVSDVISTSLKCGFSTCDTDHLNLSIPITISFEHSQEVINKINSSGQATVCVFLNIPRTMRSVLYIGYWSSRGCRKNHLLSSSTKTVCECNHLSHFAILLRQNTQEFHHAFELAVSYMGIIGVIISLLAMSAIVLTYIALKPLRNVWSHIHIHLCINLGIAQIIFIAGIDKTGQNKDHIPPHCQLLAVLLHYFFLVSFMWMLMEGVFLYLALVKVSITQSKRYLISLIFVAYGIPLVYMAVIALPVGFGLLGESYYGNQKVCFLKDSFIWFYILPVILIFLTNISFVTTACVTMWKQKKSNMAEDDIQQFFSWLKIVVSLTIIIGLTWIIGALSLYREDLALLSFFYNIAVALQGILMFFVLIIMVKPIRKYMKGLPEKMRRNVKVDRRTNDYETIVPSSDVNNTVDSSLNSFSQLPEDSSGQQDCVQKEDTELVVFTK